MCKESSQPTRVALHSGGPRSGVRPREQTSQRSEVPTRERGRRPWAPDHGSGWGALPLPQGKRCHVTQQPPRLPKPPPEPKCQGVPGPTGPEASGSPIKEPRRKPADARAAQAGSRV